jgi:gluconate 2-dehydrogenase gamma chain
VFFTMFRNLVASGFWTSRVGMADLRYMGNTVVREWQGCPPEALAKLGVSY